MRIMDFTLNSMTLLGLTLAVGIVIDDAIIVLENIYRYIEEKGLPPLEAADSGHEGNRNGGDGHHAFTGHHFCPDRVHDGLRQALLSQFGWTMAMSIMVSMLVAFTLTPALSSRLLKRRLGIKKSGHGTGEHEHTFFDRGYVSLLDWSLHHRWVIMVALRDDIRVHFCYEPIHRTRLDAAGGPERTFGFVGGARGIFNRSHREDHDGDRAKSIEKIPGVTTVLIPASLSGFMDRVNMSQITVLLAPANTRPNIVTMGANVREITRNYAYSRALALLSRMRWAAAIRLPRFAPNC